MNPQIEILYANLERTGISFDRKGLERWIFEAATINLEKEGKQKTQSNYDSEVIKCLSASILVLDRIPEHERPLLNLKLDEDYRFLYFVPKD
jgi:hypothetical protein